MKFGDRIKYLRTRRHWTQHELASKANLTRSHISQLENNRTSNPGVAALRSLAKAFEVSENTLMEASQVDLLAIPFSKSDVVIESKRDAENSASLAASTICDPELRQWLNPQIINTLNPYTIKAIVAIIRDAVEQAEHSEPLLQTTEKVPLNEQVDSKHFLPEATTKDCRKQPVQVSDYSSFRVHGRFILAI